MIDGQRMEPLEEVVCELEDEFSGPVIDALSLRRGEVRLSPNMLPPCTCVSASCLCLVFVQLFSPV